MFNFFNLSKSAKQLFITVTIMAFIGIIVSFMSNGITVNNISIFICGFLAILICSCINYQFYKKYSALIFCIAFISLILAVFKLNPVISMAFVILAFVIMLANLVQKEDIKQSKTIFKILGLYLLLALPMLAIQNFSTAVLMFIVLIIVLFVTGVKKKTIATILTAIVLIFVFEILIMPYRIYRLKHYFESLISFDFMNTGAGFILFDLFNKFGIVLYILIFLCFGYFLYKGFKIYSNTNNVFGKILALSITLVISLQAVLHILASVGILPIKMLNLPFISFDGINFIIEMATAGILINVSNNKK